MPFIVACVDAIGTVFWDRPFTMGNKMSKKAEEKKGILLKSNKVMGMSKVGGGWWENEIKNQARRAKYRTSNAK